MRLLAFSLSLLAFCILPARADQFDIGAVVIASTEANLPVGSEYLTGTLSTDGICQICNIGSGLLSLDFTMSWGVSYDLGDFNRNQEGSIMAFDTNYEGTGTPGLQLQLYDYAQLDGQSFIDYCHAGDCGFAIGTVTITQATPEPATWLLIATALSAIGLGYRRLRQRKSY